MNSSATAHAAVRDFAAAVRSHLDDLPPDEVEELTGGLEADLIERAEDGGTNFGSPADYAEELRSASGLPGRDSPKRDPIGARMRTHFEETTARIKANPTGGRTLDFFIALRPVWWIIRGWVLFHLIAIPFGLSQPGWPSSGAGTIVFIAALVLSVQWGRGRWLGWRWLPGAKIAVSVIAAVVALPILTSVVGTVPSRSVEYVQEDLPQGLWLNGRAITNIFAYDCAGNPLSDVQLFDENGAPLSLLDSETPWTLGITEQGVEYALVPNPEVTGSSGWNVYPLNTVEVPDSEYPDLSTLKPGAPPFSVTQPLADADDSCAPTGVTPDPVVTDAPEGE